MTYISFYCNNENTQGLRKISIRGPLLRAQIMDSGIRWNDG